MNQSSLHSFLIFMSVANLGFTCLYYMQHIGVSGGLEYILEGVFNLLAHILVVLFTLETVSCSAGSFNSATSSLRV